MRTLLALALLVPTFAACGPTRGAASPSAVTEQQRNASTNALELLRGRYPSLQVEEGQAGILITVRRTGLVPVILVDGVRSVVGEAGAAGVPADQVAEIEVLTSMADTMVYGDDAARRGVVKITTRRAR